MRINWRFRNVPTLDFSEKPAFHTNSSWNPRKGDPHLDVFLSRVEEELCMSLKGQSEIPIYFRKNGKQYGL